MQILYSFIIPVYNRPEETHELLQSLTELDTAIPFEVVIVEDGSDITSENVIVLYADKLNISYYYKKNSGPGDSRNYGMQKARGNYFIILDSDCILPPLYLNYVEESLNREYVDCFGGPDTAHSSFTNLQKAINFSMTSFLTTGGIRGGKKRLDKFQPRSFNMGLSKKAFLDSKGFSKIHPGEDPDLTIRLWKLGYKTKLIPEAFVYHKRRISWEKFYRQVHKFGLVRPILNKWHPETKKITYWFPTLFLMGLICAIVLLLTGSNWLIMTYVFYFVLAFFTALVQTRNLQVSLLSLVAIGVQFFGYGYGFFKSTLVLHVFNKEERSFFPQLFFK